VDYSSSVIYVLDSGEEINNQVKAKYSDRNYYKGYYYTGAIIPY